jgi:hypothetical protein
MPQGKRPQPEKNLRRQKGVTACRVPTMGDQAEHLAEYVQCEFGHWRAV